MVIASICLLWLIPVHFGSALITFTSIFLIGTFSFRDPKKSLVNLCILLLLLGAIFSPFIILTAQEVNKLNYPGQLINREHPKIQEMTAEFQASVGKNMPTSWVLSHLESYVYQKIPYDYSFTLVVRRPSIDEIMDGMTATCWGRALVGYCILKNMGYDVYVVGTYAGNHHYWLRVYENESYTETFQVGERQEPWVMFNEQNVCWTSPLDEIYRVFFEGFEILPAHTPLSLAVSSLFSAAPIGIAALYILIMKRNKRFAVYLAAVAGTLAVAFAHECIGIINGRETLLVIIMVGGLYLRVLNQKVRKPKK